MASIIQDIRLDDHNGLFWPYLPKASLSLFTVLDASQKWYFAKKN